MSKSITAVIPISQPFTVPPQLQCLEATKNSRRIVLGQKDLGMSHTSHPATPQQAVAKNSLRKHLPYRADTRTRG
jgi:hypothetical protein